MAGRRPLPTRLRELRGNAGHRALNRNEPKPRAGVPECPEHLDDRARKEWFNITGELHTLGLLTIIDRSALAAYCSAYGMWVQAETDMKRLRTFKPKTAKEVRKNYAELCMVIGLRKGALKEMKAFLTEFGMTPASRSRINAKPPEEDEEKEADPLAEAEKLSGS